MTGGPRTSLAAIANLYHEKLPIGGAARHLHQSPVADLRGKRCPRRAGSGTRHARLSWPPMAWPRPQGRLPADPAGRRQAEGGAIDAFFKRHGWRRVPVADLQRPSASSCADRWAAGRKLLQHYSFRGADEIPDDAYKGVPAETVSVQVG